MLFGSRLGFSGTPPNLLPTGVHKLLEPKSTAKIIDVLSRPYVCPARCCCMAACPEGAVRMSV